MEAKVSTMPLGILNPKLPKYDHLDPRSKEIMLKTIEFFEKKGLKKLNQDDRERVWYDDFLKFQADNKIFYTIFTPSEYGDGTTAWDTTRNTTFAEILGFYGLCYWYTFQVTALGLGPIWMGKNEAIKKKTAQMLKDGHIFAFGLSEKEHGADIYSTDMVLTKTGEGIWTATGEKYYIGNGNKAGFASTFGRFADTNEYVFFAAESTHEKYKCVRNVVNSQSYVANYALNQYPVTEANILSIGSEAWDSSLNTINVCKFNLGFGSIGICAHAFHEALNHASHRHLYKMTVTQFPQVKMLFMEAWSRLVAMRLFAHRATDYMRTAKEGDRRYLLFTPMVKMKVTCQGEEVINALWDVIAAKGFENTTYFEMAAKDIRALPKLEGTVHVNMALIIKFMPNYLFMPAEMEEIKQTIGNKNDDFLFKQGPTKGLGKTTFHDYNKIYNEFNLENLSIFKEQIKVFKGMLVKAGPDENQQKDLDFLLTLGDLFTLVVYGQLILENAKVVGVDEDTLETIFDFIVRDFSKYALQLYSKPSSSEAQQQFCQQMLKKPIYNPARFERVLKEKVYALADTYEMNP